MYSLFTYSSAHLYIPDRFIGCLHYRVNMNSEACLYIFPAASFGKIRRMRQKGIFQTIHDNVGQIVKLGRP